MAITKEVEVRVRSMKSRLDLLAEWVEDNPDHPVTSMLLEASPDRLLFEGLVFKITRQLAIREAHMKMYGIDHQCGDCLLNLKEDGVENG